jgi:hypothetical protein
MTEEDPAAQPERAAMAGQPAGRRRVVVLARRSLSRGRAMLIRLFDQTGLANKRLTVGLGIAAGVACVLGLPDQFNSFPIGNDIELPLRAASHWASGGQAYPASAMLVQRGPDLPYLYQPFLLPLLAPIATLPRDVVTAVSLILCAACAVWACRRLAIPWVAIPFVLAWPPFAEGLIVGNIQIVCFAAFVDLVYEPGDGALRPRSFLPPRDAVNGLLAAVVGVFKITQILPGLYLARRRFRAALLGAAAVVAAAIVTLPLTGLAIYGDWLAQLQRAADPAWEIGGVALGRLIGIPELPLVAAGTGMALLVRGRDSAAWLGVALIVATPSAHGYTFLFLLPGLLTIRRDFSILLAALFLGVYHGYAWWLSCLWVAYLLVASNRWASLRSVDLAPRSPAAAGRDPSLEHGSEP